MRSHKSTVLSWYNQIHINILVPVNVKIDAPFLMYIFIVIKKKMFS